jgi:hypothetical protein
MAESNRIALSLAGLHLADRVSRKDFRFLIDSTPFVCDRFQAAFLSPRVAQALLTDPTTDEFLLDHPHSDSFDILSHLICGDSVVIDDSNLDIFSALIEDLANAELSNSVLKFIENQEKLNVSNCISRFQLKSRLGLDIDRERDFIASTISDLSVDDVRGLDLMTMSTILQSDSLRILNEDWLLEFILQLGADHLKLLGDVRFEYLSLASIDLFFEQIHPTDVDDRIWHQLWVRFRSSMVFNLKEIAWNRCTGYAVRSPETPWSGLICHLTELCGGNVHDGGFVDVTSSSTSTSSNHCSAVVNHGTTDFWSTKDVKGSWIKLDFKQRLVSLTHYALTSADRDYDHPLQWTLDASKDGYQWTVLDRQVTADLKGRSHAKIFPCAEGAAPGKFWRYIRLSQTSANSTNNHVLQLEAVEVFGSIVHAASIGFVPHLNAPRQ